jgi:hypothetical protein
MKFMKIIPIKSIIFMFLLLFLARAVLNNSKGIVNFFSDLTSSATSGVLSSNKPVFKIADLSDDDKKRLIDVGAYNSKCPVPLSDLKILTVSFKDFAGVNQVGTVIVHNKVADVVLEIFKVLFEVKFPLASVSPIYNFSGSDEQSMLANNTTAFHCRPVTYSTTVMSKHSYGTAIDFNPVQNPYLRRGVVLPDAGKDYLNRKQLRIGMVESIVGLMDRFGFVVWAGSWDSPTDYMHFEFVE